MVRLGNEPLLGNRPVLAAAKLAFQDEMVNMAAFCHREGDGWEREEREEEGGVAPCGFSAPFACGGNGK